MFEVYKIMKGKEKPNQMMILTLLTVKEQQDILKLKGNSFKTDKKKLFFHATFI